MALFDDASLVVTPNGYKEGTLYSIKPTSGVGDMTVVRATTATRVNSAGLIELVPYNLLQYSEQFNNGVWGLFSSGTGVNPIITANTTTAPNGTLTADTIVFNSGVGTTAADQSQMYQTFQRATGVTYTYSFYAKGLVGGEQVMVRHADGSSYTKLTLTNDWARYQVTETSAATGTGYLEMVIRRGLNEPMNASATFYIWGFQLVEGALPKDYLRTETRLNIPRLDYSNGTCPSLLVEPQRSNIVLYSEQFDNAAWAKLNATVTANNAISPDGTQNADKIDYTNNNNYLITFGTNAQTTSYTVSCYAKKGTTDIFVFREAFYFGSTAKFNLTNGTIVTDSTGTAKITSVGNGWYRCSMTQAYTSIQTNMQWSYDSYFNTGNLYLWGAQIEAGSYITSYIPTTSAAVTRNADVISKTGISSLIGQTEGTMFAEIEVSKLIGIASRYIFHISDGTTNNRIYMAFSGSSSNVLRGRIFNGGTLQCSIDTSTITSTGTYKLALAYKNNDIVFYVNGVQIGVDTSATIPTCSRVDLGQNYANTSQLGDGINSSVLFPTRLTNAELASLTTI
jgi:hypothetical protein